MVTVHSNTARITNAQFKRYRERADLAKMPRCATKGCKRRVVVAKKWGKWRAVDSLCVQCRKGQTVATVRRLREEWKADRSAGA
jgi:hypothetical protein